LAVIACFHAALLARAPATWVPSEIRVDLVPGQQITLGASELGVPRAAARQLTLARNHNGDWLAANADGASGNSVLLADGRALALGQARLRPGLGWQVGSERYLVTRDLGGALEFDHALGQWRYDGATLTLNGSALAACPNDGLHGRLLAAWNRLAPAALTIARPLLFGGNLRCGMRIGSASVPPHTASIRRNGGTFTLDSRSDLPSPVLFGKAGFMEPVSQQWVALKGRHGLAIGGTRLGVAEGHGHLILRPSGRVRLHAEPAAVLPDGVQWTWRAHDRWARGGAMGFGAALILAAAALAVLAQRRRAGARTAFPSRSAQAPASFLTARFWGAALALAGTAALVTQQFGRPLGLAPSLLLGWSALLLWAGSRDGHTQAWRSVSALLLGLGLLFQLELALYGGDSSWTRHLQRSTALLAIGLGLACALAPKALHPGVRSATERVLMCAALLALGGIAAQVAFGDETGVFGIQPVEFAKAALVALTAHCLAIGLGWKSAPGLDEAPWKRALRLGAPLLIFLALFALALVQVDDYSPLLLLLAWSGIMLMAWALASARWRSAALLALALGSAALGVAWLRGGAIPLERLDFYGDRFQVWLAPADHPHTGQQWLQAARAIAAGGWLGHDGWLGLAAGPAPRALAIPALADDFAPAFFIHRHGLAGALLLWGLQAWLLILIVQRAIQLLAGAASVRDFRRAWLGRFLAFCLVGGGAFVAGHLLLSWGTNLAILPVMGQPMSFLSAGGSHLLFFLCPLLWIGSIHLPPPPGLPHIEENRHAGLCTT
jgi:cell division protein FtsW